MNKDLFLAIIRNDVTKIQELLSQRKKVATDDSKELKESIESNQHDFDLKSYIEAGYQLDFNLTQEIMAEIEKHSPVDALAAKTKAKLIEILRQPTSTRTKIEFIEDMPHEIQETVNLFNITPLMLASLLGRLDIIKLFISAGANVNSKTSHLGWNNAYCACQYATMTQDMNPLRLLAKNKMDLDTLLFDIDAPTNRPSQKKSLGSYYENSHKSIVIQPVKIKKDYKSVLHLAMEDLNIPLINTLLELNANPNNLTTLWCSPIMSVFMGPEARKISKLNFVPMPGSNRGNYTSEDVNAIVPSTPPLEKVSAGDTKSHKEKGEKANQEIQKKIAHIVEILIRHSAIIDDWKRKGLICPYRCESDNFRNLTEFSLGIEHFPEAKKVLVAAFQLNDIARGRIIASTPTIITLLKSGASLFQRVQEEDTALEVVCRSHNLRAIRQFNTIIKKYYPSSVWPSIRHGFAPGHLPREHQNLVHQMITCADLPEVHDREIFIAILNKDVARLAAILNLTPELVNQRYQSYLNLEQDKPITSYLEALDENAEKLKNELQEIFTNATDNFVEDSASLAQHPLGQSQQDISHKRVFDPKQALIDECGHKKRFVSSIDITPVTLAALLGDIETLETLKKYKAKFDLQCTRSCAWTPLAFAYYNAYLTGNNNVLTFVTQEVDAQGKFLREKEETVMDACGPRMVTQRRSPEPKFINVPAIRNSQNDYEPLLNHAVRNLNFRMVKSLVELGANLDIESDFGITPLMTLFKSKPQHRSDQQRKPEPHQTGKDAAALCLTESPEIKKQKEMALLLIKLGVNLSKDEGLFNASIEGPKEIITALQKLFVFAKNKQASVLPESLIEACMRTFQFSFPTKDTVMDTAMHIACREGNTHAVKTFLTILSKNNVAIESSVFKTKNLMKQTPFECATKECRQVILEYVSAEEKDKYEAMFKAQEDELQTKSKKISAGDEKSQSTQRFSDEYDHDEDDDFITRYLGGKDHKVVAEKEYTLLDEPAIKEALKNIPLDFYSPTPHWEEDLIALFKHGLQTHNVNLLNAVFTLGMNPKTHFSKISDILVSYVKPVVRHLLGRNPCQDIRDGNPQALLAPHAPTGDLTKQEEIVRLVIKFWKKSDLLCDTSWHKQLLRTIKNGKEISLLVSIFPSLKEELDPIFKAYAALNKYVYDAHPYLSTGTLNHLFKILEFRFLQLKDTSTPFHEACALGKLSVIKTFMRSFIYTDQTNHPLWLQTYVVGDHYNLHNLPKGNYTPFDLVLSKFEPNISDAEISDSADAKAKSETECSRDDLEKLKNFRALKTLFMDYFQRYWITPFIATEMRTLYQKLQNSPIPMGDLEERVRNDLRKLMISSNHWDYLGLTSRESGKKLLEAAFEKAITSVSTPKERKELEESAVEKAMTSAPAPKGLTESTSVTSTVIAQDLPDSMRYLAEDCDVDSQLIHYSDKGIALSMERVMQNATLALKISALQEKLKLSFKKDAPATQDSPAIQDGPATQDSPAKLDDSAAVSKGDSKRDKEQETLSSRTLTFIKDKLQTRLDIAMAFGEREKHMHPIYSYRVIPARDTCFDDFIIHEMREELEKLQP